MKFKINNKAWEIIEIDNDKFYETREIYLKQEHSEVRDENFVFGFCLYSHHKIYLNKNQCKEELKATLIHELIHAWLWSHGASYSSYCEDALCDTVSATNEFINKIVKDYFE
jgi:Zn-dependent peptidase ImmA (M78 family)